jgi:hypothetical protein
MRNIVFIAMLLLMAASGCVIVDMGAGGANKAPVVVKFSVSPDSIGPGEAAILSWEVQNASSISIDPGIPAAASAGAEKVAPAATTTYILTASNNAGSTRSTALLTVAGTGVIPQTPASGLPVITFFSASPSNISPGASSVLSWTTSNATGVKISAIGNVGTSGTTSVSPASTTNYVLEATNGLSSVSASTVVFVVGASSPPPTSLSLPTILSFTASPSTVTAGGSTVLSWDTLNATSASIAGVGPVDVSGSLAVNTTGTGSITFSLTATNSAGNSYANTTIYVSAAAPPPTPAGSRPVAALYVSPSSITPGSAATLGWMTSGASSIVIDNGVKSLVGITGASGTATVYPTSTTTYTLTATNLYGSTYDSKVLVVAAAPPPYGSLPVAALYLSTSNVPAGGSATLSWMTSGATSIVIDNGAKSLLGVSGVSGSVNVSPTSTTTYTLTATNSYGSSYASKVLTVY